MPRATVKGGYNRGDGWLFLVRSIDQSRLNRMLTRGNLIWLVCYLATMAAVVWGLFVARQRTLAAYSGPAGLAAWREWQQAAEERSRDPTAPVQRRAPASGEPPALLMMRDNFPAILGGAIVTGSFLYGFLMLTIRGVMRRPAPRL
jgi:hypothetical protein